MGVRPKLRLDPAKALWILQEAASGRGDLSTEALARRFESLHCASFTPYLQRLKASGHLSCAPDTGVLMVPEKGLRALREKTFQGPPGSAAQTTSSLVRTPPADLKREIPYHQREEADMRKPKDTPPGPARPVRYEKQVSLARAPWGNTYLGKQLSLDRRVVIREYKDLFRHFPFQRREKTIARMSRIASEYAALNSPYIAAVLDLDMEGLPPCLIMEYVPGGNLRTFMDRCEGSVPVSDAVRLLMQVLEGVAYAHQHSVLHRNLKPENILIDEYGRAKVSDFNLAPILFPEDGRKDRPPAPDPGALPYMDPELRGDLRLCSEKSDMYSMGILFYEMLTGRLPGRRSPLPHEVRPEVPTVLSRAIDRLTSDNPRERYRNLLAALEELHQSGMGARNDRG